MEFTVKVDQFDGPLDLMLHLIKEKQLDIFDLDIVVLTEQYLDYIHQMEKLHLDIASEYMVELASLIEIKSKKLLPAQTIDIEDNYEESKEEDLVKRLIEYQKYKEVSSQFEELYQERAQLHDKPQSNLASEFIEVEENYAQTSPYELIKAMKHVLNRYTLANPYEVNITQAKISVDERRKQLETRIHKIKEKVFTLKTLMDDCNDVYDVVVTFISILNMVNENVLNFTVNNEEIYFSKGVEYEQ